MKKVLFLFAVMFCLGAQAQKDNYKIIGKFSDLKADSIRLEVMAGKGIDVLASAEVKNGHFTLEGYSKYDRKVFGAAYFKGEVVSMSPFFIEKGTVTYSGELGRNPIYDVKGGKYTTKVFGYCKNPEYLALVNELKALENAEQTDENKIKVQKISRKISGFVFSVDYTMYDDNHPLHQIHLSDQYYYDKKYDEFVKQANHVVKTYPDHPETARIKRVIQYNEERIKREKNPVKEETIVGTQMMDVASKNKAGEEILASEIIKKNKLTLIDFWASWCGPCRAEFPHLRMAYKHYRSKGFEIIAISLDSKEAAWLKALEKENTPWINGWDKEAFESKNAKNYKIRGIPYNILVDANGKIVAESLRGEGLEEFLKKYL
jgi:thiol-disulfide isomerase/thioredoxin